MDESEIAQMCAACETFETVGSPTRFNRCSKCKKVYYVRIHAHAYRSASI